MRNKLPAKSSLIAGSVVAGFLMSVGPAHSQTLTQALAAAYMNNPELLAARASLRSDDEAVPQALANWRPRVELSGDVARTHTHLNTRSAGRDQLRSPRNTSLDVTQPLYRGLRTIAGVTKAELDVRSAQSDIRLTTHFQAGRSNWLFKI